MKRTGKKLISKLRKHGKQIEQDRADIEWEETQGSFTGDAMSGFKGELRRALQSAVDECLDDELAAAGWDERTERELLRYELNKALANSAEARKQYIQRQREFQQRFKK